MRDFVYVRLQEGHYQSDINHLAKYGDDLPTNRDRVVSVYYFDENRNLLRLWRCYHQL